MATKPDSYHHGDLRAALVEAASTLVEEEGAARLSLREVARRVGVSHAAPYHHFPDKSALIAAVAARGFEALHREIEARTGQGGPRDLQSAAVTYVGFAVEHPELFRLMFSSELSDGDSYPELQEASRRAYSHITSTLGQGPASIASWSLVHGLAILLLERQIGGARRDREEAEALARDVTRVLWEGLGGRGGRGGRSI